MSYYWLAVIWVVFFIPEVVAAIRKRGGTFSEWVWDSFGVRHYRRVSVGRRAVLAVFLLYLTGHLVLEWPAIGVIVLAVPLGFLILLAVWENRRDAR